MKYLITLIFFFQIAIINAQSSVKLSSTQEDELTKFIQSKLDYYDSPSIAVAVVSPDSIIYKKMFGNTKEGHQYIIGSCTKSITALITLKLQKEGLLNIDDPVHKYLDWFVYKNKEISNRVTLRDLLQHSSGIPRSYGMSTLPNTSFDLKGYYAKKLNKLECDSNQGTRFEYCNLNYDLLGFIIEEVTKKSFLSNLQDRIAEPLNLNNTEGPNSKEIIQGYQYLLWSPILKYNKEQHEDDIASGLVSSSLNDMSRYLQLLLKSYLGEENSVIDEDISKQIFKSENENITNYGLGWFLSTKEEEPYFWHTGRVPSFETHMWIAPKYKAAAIVMINSNLSPKDGIANGIYNLIANKPIDYTSSFDFRTQYLPFFALGFFILFTYLFWKWKNADFGVILSKKLLPNIILFFCLSFVVLSLTFWRNISGISLQKSAELRPNWVYFVLFILALIAVNVTIWYFTYASKHFAQQNICDNSP